MAAIRHAHTKPELLIRSGLHKRGFRFRLHSSDLPGKPDIVLKRYRAIVFVNGCFWHGHGCEMFRWPTTRKEFWRSKIEANMRRDQTSISALRASGWKVATVWECALKGRQKVDRSLLFDDLTDFIRDGKGVLALEGKKAG
ncbi:very short patch repair endonuclease [Parasphingopyxis sp. CP4]|uniref:very short patch repair endonuclease n=1 Tax=Parasphingopyxis sp. CP4 TaxID=2724527 RepID=UPI00351A43DF